MVPQPLNERIWLTFVDFFINFPRYLYPRLSSQTVEPFPELWDPVDRIIIPIGVYRDVRLQMHLVGKAIRYSLNRAATCKNCLNLSGANVQNPGGSGCRQFPACHHPAYKRCKPSAQSMPTHHIIIRAAI